MGDQRMQGQVVMATADGLRSIGGGPVGDLPLTLGARDPPCCYGLPASSSVVADHARLGALN